MGKWILDNCWPVFTFPRDCGGGGRGEGGEGSKSRLLGKIVGGGGGGAIEEEIFKFQRVKSLG